LDAGCGSQQYRQFCGKLRYFSQDFAQYSNDDTSGFASKMGGATGYKYGPIDYVGNIWSINVPDRSFDAVICTEVLEHIPFPNETISEFSRIIRSGGVLILTVPSNCLRHMDPYFFYSGFSDNYLKMILDKNLFEIITMKTIGDYFSWIAVELLRSMRGDWLSIPMLLPAFIYMFFKRKTDRSVRTLCMGYLVIARRL